MDVISGLFRFFSPDASQTLPLQWLLMCTTIGVRTYKSSLQKRGEVEGHSENTVVHEKAL